MTMFFANKKFYSRLCFDISKPAANQEAHDLVKHMDDILE